MLTNISNGFARQSGCSQGTGSRALQWRDLGREVC
jgi:hypothetical protein